MSKIKTIAKDVKPQETEQIEVLQNRILELENNWKRALADYKNLESRIERQKTEIIRFSMLPILLKIFSVLDHLNLAVAHHAQEDWVRLIRDQVHDILTGEGIEEISALGKIFDPNLMECVEQVEGEKDAVMKIAETGYKQGDRILRVAKVEVGKGKTNG